MEEDAGVGEGGAAGCVGGYGAEGSDGLAGAANKEQGADVIPGCDGTAGKNTQPGGGGKCGNGDETDVGGSRGQARGALGGGHAVYLVAAGEHGFEGRMFKVPHEGSGIQEADGGNAHT